MQQGVCKRSDDARRRRSTQHKPLRHRVAMTRWWWELKVTPLQQGGRGNAARQGTRKTNRPQVGGVDARTYPESRWTATARPAGRRTTGSQGGGANARKHPACGQTAKARAGGRAEGDAPHPPPEQRDREGPTCDPRKATRRRLAGRQRGPWRQTRRTRERRADTGMVGLRTRPARSCGTGQAMGKTDRAHV